AVAWQVDEQRRGDLVPVPRVVPVVLVMRAQLAGVHLERDDGARVQVVTGPRVARPRAGVAGAPVREPELRVVAAGDPHRCAAGLPRIAGPRVVAGLAWARDRVRLPHLVAGLGVERGHEAANAALAARHAYHDLAARRERGHRHVVAGVVVGDGFVPHDGTGPRIQRDDPGVG